MNLTRLGHPFVSILSAGALLFGALPAHAQDGGSRRFDRSLALEDSAATSANVSVGDVNGDGHQDIVLVKGRHWPLPELVLLGRGNGTFQPAYPLGAPPDRSYSGVLVDVDRDGDLDVVVSNDTPDAKIVHLNDGRGRFTVGSTFGRREWSTRHVAVADLNGDALPDAILANRYGNNTGLSQVCFGVPGGRFAAECVGVAPGSATTIKPADFNGDGFPDLAAPHRDGGQSFVYLNDGKGGFTERRPFGPPNANIRSAEPADLDGDGVLDLVVIDERTGPAIYRGRADGTFSAAEPLGAGGATPYAIAVADLDRNGRPDIIVGFVESRPIVYFNDGPTPFTPVPFGDNEGTAYGFAVGDMDEDGFLDIAMARSEARNMLYFGGRETPVQAPAGPMTPSPPHEALTFFEGSWTIEERPAAQGLIETCGWLPAGRRHMVCRSTWRVASGAREGWSIFSYRASDSSYAYYGLRAGGAVEPMVGRRLPDGWEFLGESGEGRLRQRTRVTITPLAPQRFRLVASSAEGDGPWVVVSTEHYVPAPRQP